jgi:uncharacterized protein (DUF433 family)
MKLQDVGQHLAVDRHNGHDRLTFKGTRLQVKTVLHRLARGDAYKQLLARWPKLTRKAIKEALNLAAEALVEPYLVHNTRVRELLDAERDEEVQRLPIIEVGRYLNVHPCMCFGKLTFKDRRLPVETILTYVAMKGTIDYIRKAWPQLTREAVVEAVKLAAAALEEKYAASTETLHEPAHSGRAN